ncbi:MAG TPA: hypothetical protein H9966_04890 [Candidatus Prevotella avicola]|uniref:Peptidase C39 domain-containing protein n=1 Tax=Candidatus Prevotella avicola TaxID=2838738 RepID=A0A9D2FYS4_9BACT|nr:hypothetical protein [Candidatus Prevotella avicola]
MLYWNQNHFVVLYKIKGKRAYFVADPAKGLVTYSHDDFVGHWMLTHLGGEECGVAMVAGGQPKGY